MSHYTRRGLHIRVSNNQPNGIATFLPHRNAVQLNRMAAISGDLLVP
jgi:hypothetical protein